MLPHPHGRREDEEKGPRKEAEGCSKQSKSRQHNACEGSVWPTAAQVQGSSPLSWSVTITLGHRLAVTCTMCLFCQGLEDMLERDLFVLSVDYYGS